MHADRARDKNYLMTNVIYTLFITIHREDLNRGVKGEEVEVNERKFYDATNLAAWRYFYLNDALKDQGQECWVINTGEEEGRNTDTNATRMMVGGQIAFARLYILKQINTHRKICPGFISPQNNKEM